MTYSKFWRGNRFVADQKASFVDMEWAFWFVVQLEDKSQIPLPMTVSSIDAAIQCRLVDNC